MSASADVILFSGRTPTTHEHLDCPKCLQVLMPHLDSCRKNDRTASAVAELRLTNGVTVKFASANGVIEVCESRPIFGHSRRLLGLIPIPAKWETHADSTDFAIHKVIARAFGT